MVRRAVALRHAHAGPIHGERSGKHERIHVAVRPRRRLTDDVAEVVSLDDAKSALRIADRATPGEKGNARP